MTGEPGSRGTAGELLDALARRTGELMPDADRARRLLTAARCAAPDRAAPVDAALCDRITEAARAQSRHFGLTFLPDGVPDAAPDSSPAAVEPPAADTAAVRRRAASVSAVTRSADGIATIALDALDDVAIAAPYLDAAFALVRGSRGLVLDLRTTAGGHPATAALVIGWLLGGARVQLSTVVYVDRDRQWWTPGLRADRELAGLPVAVLISGATLASAEALAYHLKARQRATLVGETTGGAADHVVPVRLSAHVRALLPNGYVVDARTGTNWEGTGVEPDVTCAAGDAPARAQALLLG